MTRRAAAAIFVLFVASTAAATGLEDEPDSLHAVLGLGLSRTGLTEISGASVTEFRLYTESKRSRIAWWNEGTLYVYELDGPGHEQRAGALLEALRTGSLVTFVANRHPKRRHGTVPVAEVRALQIATSIGAIVRQPADF